MDHFNGQRVYHWPCWVQFELFVSGICSAPATLVLYNNTGEVKKGIIIIITTIIKTKLPIILIILIHTYRIIYHLVITHQFSLRFVLDRLCFSFDLWIWRLLVVISFTSFTCLDFVTRSIVLLFPIDSTWSLVEQNKWVTDCKLVFIYTLWFHKLKKIQQNDVFNWTSFNCSHWISNLLCKIRPR